MSEVADAAQEFRALRTEFTRFVMSYRFGMNELMTKINILKDEFTHLHSYSPIEHVSSRIKSPDSIAKKAVRKGIPLTFDGLRAGLFDIAGVRITCSFIADAYTVKDMLASQHDVRVIDFEDYIANPKPNGYKSLHMTVEIPVFMSDRVQPVCVEVQIRTIAMDFWASLEHKIFYKYDGEVPQSIRDELQDTARIAASLDTKMERLHSEVLALEPSPTSDSEDIDGVQARFLRALMATPSLGDDVTNG